MANQEHVRWLRGIIKNANLSCFQSSRNQDAVIGLIESSYQMLDSVSPLILSYANEAANQRVLNRDLRSWQMDNITTLYQQTIYGLFEILPLDISGKFKAHISVHKCFGCASDVSNDRTQRYNALFCLGFCDTDENSYPTQLFPYLMLHYDESTNKVWQTQYDVRSALNLGEISGASAMDTFIFDSSTSVYHRLKQRD